MNRIEERSWSLRQEAWACRAAGVGIGTRFVAAEEADAHPCYVEALVAASSEDTVLTEAFAVMWAYAPRLVLRSAVDP